MLAAFLPLILFTTFAGFALSESDGSGDGSSGADFDTDPANDDPEAPIVPIDPGDPDDTADPVDPTDPTDPVADPDPADPPTLNATIAADGGTAGALEPVIDTGGNLGLLGTAGADVITVNPDAATPVAILPGAGADSVTAGLFHSFDTSGDAAEDDVTIDVTAAALAAAAGDAVAATEDGFTARLDPADELTLNLADDVAGSVLAVEFETDDQDPDATGETINYGLAFYLLPPGVTLPEGAYAGTEADLIETYGLQRIGDIDLGSLSLSIDTSEGFETVIEDSRQTELPQILSNREIITLDAVFATPPVV